MAMMCMANMTEQHNTSKSPPFNPEKTEPHPE